MATITGYNKAQTDTLLAGPKANAINALQRSLSTVQGVPVAVGGNVRADSTVRATTGTHRVHYYATTAATDLRLVYTGWFNSTTGQRPDTDYTAAGTVKASIELAGTIYPVTFGGNLTATLSPGAILTSDPVALDITPGTDVAVRTYLSGTEWHVNRVAYVAGSGGFTATTDLTPAGSAAIPDATSFTNLFGPSLILGTPLTASAPSLLLVGDSNLFGIGDGPGDFQGWNMSNAQFGRGGWAVRAAAPNGIGCAQLGNNGDAATYFTGNAARFRRYVFASTCRTALVNYGVNDIYAYNRTLAQVQADLLTIWTGLANRGLRVLQTTVTPSATSTDGFRTTTNQAFTAAFNTIRSNLNDWIRAGAPVDSTTKAAVAVGTGGALTAGQAGHPLYTWLELTDTVESARNSGIWKAPVTTRTVTDGATTAASFNATSATAAFTAADLGRTVIIAGAGSAGGLFTTTITSVSSATQVGLKDAAVTTVSAASLTIVDAVTQDGTHPQPYMQALMAAAISAQLAAATI